MTKVWIIYLFIGMLFLSGCIPRVDNHENTIKIVPEPLLIKNNIGSFKFSPTTTCYFKQAGNEGKVLLQILNDFLENSHQLNLKATENKQENAVLFINNNELLPEAYHLTVKKNNIIIEAADFNGFFYGLQSLFQLIPLNNSTASLMVPAVTIEDAPNYSWRGLHLDVSRHFFSKSEVMKIIDAMALLKLNVFHWHLTDDQGWRIEIKRYPKLTEVSAWRDQTIIGHMAEHPKRFDNKPYGGFYTQKEIKEVIEYAKKRGVKIVPEIEMPGHAVAVLKAYPQYSCAAGEIQPFNEWGVSDDVFCAGNDSTFSFLFNVLDEVAKLFPHEYIHIGGDECPKTKWKVCEKCQQRIKDEQLKGENELQSYFVKRIEKYLHSKHKKLIGWDEIIEGGLPERATVMCWRGNEHAIKAANEGHDVVMTPNPVLYFDHYQSEKLEPLAIGGLTTMQEIYDWNVMPKKMSRQAEKHIIGGQANMWTEYITSNEHLEYMLFPRVVALAEKLWTSPENLSYDNFNNKLPLVLKHLDRMGINYRIPYPKGFETVNTYSTNEVEIALTSEFKESEIYFTFDSTQPYQSWIKYEDTLKFSIKDTKILHTVTILPNGRKSHVNTGVFIYSPQTKDTLEQVKNGLLFTWQKGVYSSATKVTYPLRNTMVIDSVYLPKITSDKYFGALFKGLIKVPEDGNYVFELLCDDGGVLYIDDHLLINSDGFKYDLTRKGFAQLKKGYHSIQIKYFQAKYGKILNLKCIFNGQELPLNEKSFFHLPESS